MQAAARALEISFLMATNVIVDGTRNVTNEVTGSYYSFPIVDYPDMDGVYLRRQGRASPMVVSAHMDVRAPHRRAARAPPAASGIARGGGGAAEGNLLAAP